MRPFAAASAQAARTTCPAQDGQAFAAQPVLRRKAMKAFTHILYRSTINFMRWRAKRYEKLGNKVEAERMRAMADQLEEKHCRFPPP